MTVEGVANAHNLAWWEGWNLVDRFTPRAAFRVLRQMLRGWRPPGCVATTRLT